MLANQRIVITAGQSTVSLKGGNVAFACPGKFMVRASSHDFLGPQKINAMARKLPRGLSTLNLTPPQKLAEIEQPGLEDSCINYEVIYARRGPAYKASQTTNFSHYDEPIERDNGRAASNSRRHGDASDQVQRNVINVIRAKAEAAGLDKDDYAMLLAIAKTESGFKPDAAAGTTSASDIGQFIDSTGRHCGLYSNADRFCIDRGAEALAKSYADTKDIMQKDYSGSDLYKMIYAYHHDGPSLNYSGKRTAEARVMPDYKNFEAAMCI